MRSASASMSSGSTTQRVLRSLDHMRQGPSEKFSRKLRPSYMQPRIHYMPPKDRIKFWNIVPGDHVKLRSGAVGHNEQGRPIRGEGIVDRVDRTTNRIWLRDLSDDHKLAPKIIRHAIPRMVDPEGGPEKGFSGNVNTVARPVHYSKVMLKVPDSEHFASRVENTTPYWDKRRNMFAWRRFAVIKDLSEEAVRSGNVVRRVEVPWPHYPQRKRPFNENLADYATVTEETWVPWVPEDPVLLPSRRARSTEAGEADAAERRVAWEKKRSELLSKAGADLETPPGAQTYAGFHFRAKIRPPPIAQMPSPAEHIGSERERLSEFVNDEETQRHVEQGGQVFAAADYLDAAPLYGPAAGGNWNAPAEPSTGTARTAEGRLANAPGMSDLHNMPLELLMGDELSNMHGLKWRIRRFNERRKIEKEAAATNESERADLLKELKALQL